MIMSYPTTEDLVLEIESDVKRSPSVEQGVKSLIEDARHFAEAKCAEGEARVRQSPKAAIAIALAAGYLAHQLPLRAILVAKVRILVALAPPVLLALGAAKTCEYLQNKARGH